MDRFKKSVLSNHNIPNGSKYLRSRQKKYPIHQLDKYDDESFQQQYFLSSEWFNSSYIRKCLVKYVNRPFDEFVNHITEMIKKNKKGFILERKSLMRDLRFEIETNVIKSKDGLYGTELLRYSYTYHGKPYFMGINDVLMQENLTVISDDIL